MPSIHTLFQELANPDTLTSRRLEPRVNEGLAAVRAAQHHVAQALHLCGSSAQVAALCLADVMETLMLRAVPVVMADLKSKGLEVRGAPELLVAPLQAALLQWLRAQGKLSPFEVKKAQRQLLRLPVSF